MRSSAADQSLRFQSIASIGEKRAIGQQHGKAIDQGVPAPAPDATDLFPRKLQLPMADGAHQPAKIGLGKLRRSSA